MGHVEHKVDIEIKQGEQSRRYRGDWAYVCIMDEYGGRWMQQPSKWGNGVALFSAGVEALRAVAEDDGDERFKLAARAALDAIAKFNPGGVVDGKAGTGTEEFGEGGCCGDGCGDECACKCDGRVEPDIQDTGAGTDATGGFAYETGGDVGVSSGCVESAESGGRDAVDGDEPVKGKGRAAKKRGKKGA